MAGSGWLRHCRNLVSVLACFLASNLCFGQALPTESTGSLAFYGYTTKKVRPADLFIVDFTSTPTITGVVYSTTTTINVDPGDPWTFDSYTTGVDLRGIAGTWDMTESSPTLVLDTRQGATYYDQGELLPNCTDATPTSPATPDVPFTFWALGNATSYQCYDPDTLTTVTVEVTTLPDSILDLGTTGSGIKYRFTPNSGMEYGSGSTTSTYGLSADIDQNASVGTNLTVGDNADIGNLLDVGQYITVGDGSSLPVAAGSIRCEGYALILNHAHFYTRAYVSGGLVVGYGRQFSGPAGAQVWATEGTCTTPLCMAEPAAGYQVTVGYTDQQGMRFVNHWSGVEVGSVASWFNFDDTIATSGSLETSTTVNIGGSYEGQATIPDTTDTVTVSSSVITASDVVVVTYVSPATGGALWVEDLDAGNDFTIRSTVTVTGDTSVNWKILR